MIGQTIKNYVIEEMIGRGGMGVVYKARDTKLNRLVALKVIRPELCSDEDRRRRFVQEARAASAVNHPAIAHLYEIEESSDTTFIAMEYVEGSTLRQLIVRRELDLSSSVDLASQVADALARAHEAGIIHRDIKSDNIMVTKDGHPKILDFGLAKRLGPATEPGDGSGVSRAETATLTRAGMILGTVAYMSPEQARGLPVDKRSDIFSFGVVLYEMIAGKLPFEGASALDTMHSLAFDRAQPVSSIRSDIPYSLQRVVERCLRKKPEERYQDLRDAVADLKGVRRDVDSGLSGGVPVMERVRGWFSGLSTRGVVWTSLAGAALGGLGIAFLLGPARNNLGGTLMLAIIGLLIFRRFRNRGQREIRRFVKKASALREVRLVTFHRGQFTVVADNPSARTYVKLNALLAASNQRLFHGEPMTMVVRETMGAEEMTRLLSSPGVQFVRDGATRKKGDGP